MQPPSDLPSITRIADAIDRPPGDWMAKCYTVVCEALRAGILPGEPRYGLYNGPVCKSSIYGDGKLLKREHIRHGWIVEHDGDKARIIDPTRWVFTAPDQPFLYATTETDTAEYDMGAQTLRTQLRSATGPPEWDEEEAQYILAGLSSKAKMRVLQICHSTRVRLTPAQLCWVASAPLKRLGDHALEIFQWIISEGHRSFIPIDHQRAILPEAKREHLKKTGIDGYARTRILKGD